MAIDFEVALLHVILFWILVTPHEFAHAWVAVRLGDPLPKQLNRLTLNPLAHAELLGTIILPFLSAFLSGAFLGWGKPVPVNPSRLRGGSLGFVAVSLAGPLANLLLTVTFAALTVLLELRTQLYELTLQAAQFSAYLALFNLLPVPPLDGSRLLLLLPAGESLYRAVAQYGFLVLILLFSFTSAGQVLAKLSWEITWINVAVCHKLF